MLGAIIGDIVGSIYEWDNIKTTEFPFFQDCCFFTDDTVMTCAVAEAVMAGGRKEDFIHFMKEYGKLYPDAGYGGFFSEWIWNDDCAPYNSFGNGSAMRVSPCLTKRQAMDCTVVTHNHPEGIKGALAVFDAIQICKKNPADCKDLVRSHLEREYGYDLSRSLDEIRPGYRFNETCQETVPQAVVAFLESTDFESAIRYAISLGGDSDTLAAITGSIAEAAYVIPDWMRERALGFLDGRLASVVLRYELYTNCIDKQGGDL